MIQAILTRQKMQDCHREEIVRIGDEYTEDDGTAIPMGPVTGAWWEIPLPDCPDCGGELVWYEAGYVPGTRKCTSCGSLFSVGTREEPEPDPGPKRHAFECDNGHRWTATEAEDQAAGHRCPECGEYWQ